MAASASSQSGAVINQASPVPPPPLRDHSTGHSSLEQSLLVKDAIEIDYGRLYFVCLPHGCAAPPPPPLARDDGGSGSGQEDVLFCGTDEYEYQHFFADFGPLHLGHVHAFCQKLGRLLEQESWNEEGKEGGGGRPVYVYSSDHPHRRSNAAVLVLAYAVSSSAVWRTYTAVHTAVVINNIL